MSDLFGSDASDSEGSARQGSSLSALRSAPSKAARGGGSQTRASATPEPRAHDATDDLFGGDSDDENGASTPPHTTAASGDALDNLFDGDSSASDSGRPAKRKQRSAMDIDDADHSGDDGDGDGEHAAKRSAAVIDVAVPVLAKPRSADGKYVVARTPNLLQLDPRPFAAAAYEDLIPREHSALAHGVKDAVSADMATAVEGIIANTIRWRPTAAASADGRMGRESNARLVRWSDGSTTIVVGGPTPESYSIAAESLVAPGGQHCYAAVHHASALMMQSHARLTDQWLCRQSVQSASGRLAVSKLLARVRARAAGPAAVSLDAGARGTRFRNIDTDPELLARRAVEEEERRERLRRKEEKTRERREARELQQAGRAPRADASDDETGYLSVDDDSVADRPASSSYARSRGVREPGRFAAAAAQMPARGVRGAYVDEEDDGFVVDDDEELEVGPRDEFDDEEEEEEMAARRLNGAKRGVYSDDDEEEGDAGRDGRREGAGRSGKPRRVMVSDDEDDDEDDDL
ncbi:Paf1 complex component [Coemansia erecta]|uniref:Paf1 complex component n=1 Tax=Coemansia erecta TaxID=147472 RepID=A0A9W7Y1V5_9FUNG|nr:Paf1 complex component [Coemansia erecta]